MKKIKFLALMMLAGSLVFTSCKKDDDETVPAPSISFSGGMSAVVPLTGDTNIVFNATVTAEGKIDALTVNEKKVEANGTVHYGTPTEVSDAKGETSYVYNFDMTFNAASFVDGTTTFKTLKYEMTVTDKEGQSLTKTYTVTLEQVAQNTPLGTEANFEWVKTAASSSMFGLDWYQNNVKALFAYIRKGTADKFVILNKSEWSSITTKEDLAIAIELATDITGDYKAIQIDYASHSYDIVLGTKVGTTYEMIHITQTTDNASGTRKIIGKSKK